MGHGSGNKSTITFAQSGFVGCFTKIGAVDFELGDDNVSCLETDGFEAFEMHDLATMSDSELEALFDTEKGYLFDAGLAPVDADTKLKLGRKELITITWAARLGEATGASFAAWGAIKKMTLPEHVNNTTQRQMIAIKWLNRDLGNEDVKPIWTPATAAV